MKDIILRLQKLNKEIATMESCTGGYVANAITNVEGASLVFKFGAVTYSNEYKKKLGVKEDVINTYSVYSMECAISMSKAISDYTNANYGVGITGKLNREDVNNLMGDNNRVYICLYDRDKDEYVKKDLCISSFDRVECKEEILKEIVKMLREHIFY